MGSANLKLALSSETEKHNDGSDTTFSLLPFELFSTIASHLKGREKVFLRLVSRWFYNASQRVINKPVLDADEIEALDQDNVGYYSENPYQSATYLELCYDPSPCNELFFVPRNTFTLTRLEGPEANAPESTYTGQWVSCPSLHNIYAEFRRPRKQDAKQVRLIFDTEYHVGIGEDSPYTDRSSFQWIGKERVQSTWRFSVNVRSDGTVYGGGKGFGCLQQTFTGIWCDGIVDMMCNYSDGSSASFVGSYELCELAAEERKHTDKRQAFALEMTVTILSLGSILENAQIVRAGDTGTGRGIYVPSYLYEGILKTGPHATGFGPNEFQYTLMEEANEFPSYMGCNRRLNRMPLGRAEQALRLQQRRLLGANKPEPCQDNPLYNGGDHEYSNPCMPDFGSHIYL